MYEVSGLLQLDFPLRLTETIVFQPTPYGGYKHYFRYHLFEDKESRNNRPVLLAGIKLKLVFEQKDFVELNAEYNLVLDNKPVHLLAFILSIGPVFR